MPTRSVPTGLPSTDLLRALQLVRKLPGYGNRFLVIGSDAEPYVVSLMSRGDNKWPSASEMLASRLAQHVGLTLPRCEAIEVSNTLVTRALKDGSGSTDTSLSDDSAVYFGSRFTSGRGTDCPTRRELLFVRNIKEYAGMLAFDKWTGAMCRRRAILHRPWWSPCYTVVFVDFALSFAGIGMGSNEGALQGVCSAKEVYEAVQGWSSFEPWLTKIECISHEVVLRVAESIPPHWYGHDLDSMAHSVENLVARKTIVKDRLRAFRDSSRKPFENWGKSRSEI